jgi:hypothetical protein
MFEGFGDTNLYGHEAIECIYQQKHTISHLEHRRLHRQIGMTGGFNVIIL